MKVQKGDIVRVKSGKGVEGEAKSVGMGTRRADESTIVSHDSTTGTGVVCPD